VPAHLDLGGVLHPDAWRDPETEIYVFSAEVF